MLLYALTFNDVCASRIAQHDPVAAVACSGRPICCSRHWCMQQQFIQLPVSVVWMEEALLTTYLMAGKVALMLGGNLMVISVFHT